MRRPCMALLVLVLLALACLGTTEGLRNRSGKTATGVTITFSEKVRVSSYDKSVFAKQEPTGRAQTLTFSGGQLANGGSFSVNWTPSSATIEDYEWATGPDLSGPLEATVETNEYDVAHDSQPTASLQGTVTRTIERGILPFRATYLGSLEGMPAGATLVWDTDIYIDSDGDGNTENDADAAGASLDLVYTENYNPTVKLVVKTASGAELGTWKNMVRNDFTAGVRIVLDGEALLALTGTHPSSVQWQQLHMEQNSFEYMTEYVAESVEPSALLTQCVPQYAGRYVYALGDGDKAPRVDAWVAEMPTAAKHLSLTMADVWNDGWDAAGNRIEGDGGYFTDDEAKQTLQYLAGEGFDSIEVVAPLVWTQVLPTPVLSHEAPNSPSLDDLRWVLPLISEPGLITDNYVSLLAPAVQQQAAGDLDSLSRDYYEAFFVQLQAGAVELAALGAEYGTSKLTLSCGYLFGISEIAARSSSTARWVAQQWVDTVKAVRQVFPGSVELTWPGPDTEAARPLIRVPDSGRLLFGGYGFWGDDSWRPRIQATRTAEELRAALTAFASADAGPTAGFYGVPLCFPIGPSSFIGAARAYDLPGAEQMSYDGWREDFSRGGYAEAILNGDVLGALQPSFRDQCLALETFIPALVATADVNRISFWGQYWKLMDFTDFAPQDVLEFHQVMDSSLQGKPGFQVVKLWASILDPNERNAYRHVRTLPSAGIGGRAAGTTLAEPGPSAPQTDAGGETASVPGQVAVSRPVEFAVPSMIHGVAEWGGMLLLHDWETGSLYSLNIATGTVGELGRVADSASSCDIVAEGDTVYLGLTRALDGILAYSVSERRLLPSVPLGRDVGFSAQELPGMEKEGSLFYLLGAVNDASGWHQQLVVYDTTRRAVVTKSTVPDTYGELVGLELWQGGLYSLAYQRAVVVHISVDGSTTRLEEGCSASSLSPGSSIGAGNLRAFYISDSLICLGTVGENAQLYVAPASEATRLTKCETPLTSGSATSGTTADSGDSAPVRTLTFQSANAFAMSLDGSVLAVAGSSSISLVESSQWTTFRTLVVPAAAMAVALSPDGQTLAAGLIDNTTCIWDVPSGRILHVLSARPYSTAGLAFSPDGTVLASATQDAPVDLWDVETWKELPALVGLPISGTCLAFSASGRLLAAATIYPSGMGPKAWIVLWDVATGQVSSRFNTGAYSLAFSPDGKFLCSEDRLWDLHSSQVLRYFSGHTGAIDCAAFSPDGEMLASASSDTTVRLWRVSTGECLATLTGHADEATFVQFTPDGKLLISGARDRTLKIWQVERLSG